MSNTATETATTTTTTTAAAAAATSNDVPNKQQPGPPAPGNSTAGDQASPESDYSQYSLTKEAIEQTDRILKCDPSDYSGILNVPTDANEYSTTAAFRKLGCLINPFLVDPDPDNMSVEEEEDVKTKMREERFKGHNKEQVDKVQKAFNSMII
jgi:hypothetical protein